MAQKRNIVHKLRVAVASGLGVAFAGAAVAQVPVPPPPPANMQQAQTVQQAHQVILVTAENFDDVVVRATKPVILEFGATWCPPCKAIEHDLKPIVAKHGDKIVFARVDIDQSPELAARYSTGSIPALFIIKDAKIEDVRSGYGKAAKAWLENWVEKLTGTETAKPKVAARLGR